MNHFRSFYIFLFGFLPFFVSAQEKKSSINLNIRNFTLKDAYEDVDAFPSKNVFSVSTYKLPQKGVTNPKPKKINNRLFQLDNYREYLSDGRKTLAKYYVDNAERITKYYYDSAFNKLILTENIETAKIRNYHWLFYNIKSDLTEEFQYNVTAGNPFEYRFYSRNSILYFAKDARIEIKTYNDKGVAENPVVYVFSPGFFTVSSPAYESKWQKFKLLNGEYKPIETKGYLVADRNVNFTYDELGYPLTETWYKPENKLENQTEFHYSDNHHEQVEQKYQNFGTKKANLITRKYNQYNNLIFEQSTESNGNQLDSKLFEYVYDEKGNWTEKKEYLQRFSNGKLGKKELLGYEIREIKYYQPGQTPIAYKLPELPLQVNELRKSIPKQAIKKQKELNEITNDLKAGNFDLEITLKSAQELEAFTPKYWTVNQTVYGDLDNVAGDEAVIVYDTPTETENGHQRWLAIFKKENNLWVLWHQTGSPVMSDDAGGTLGDPLQAVKIEHNSIVITHFGGSRQKWTYSHSYQFQKSKWVLINAHINFGAPCDYFVTLDYNLMTGDANARKFVQRCSDKSTSPEKLLWQEKLKIIRPLPLMDDFIPGENTIKIPKQKDDIYY